MSEHPLSAGVLAHREQGRFLDFPGLAGQRVFVLDTRPGDDEAVLLLHGFPSSSQDFSRILPRLAANNRVVTLDLPGFGLSDKPVDYSYSLHEQADIVLLALRALAVPAVRIVAHDMGTSVACELLARRERGLLQVAVRSLVLMNGSVHIELCHLTPSQKLLRSPLGPLFSHLSSQRLFLLQMRRILGKPVPAEDLTDMWSLLQHKGGMLRLPRSIVYVEERYRFWHRWIGALTRLDLPTLVLWGPKDPVAVPAIAERLFGEIPGARLQWLDGLGHYPQLEDPAAVTAALLEFWEHSSRH